MIFVALGTQKFPFDRLLRRLDEMLEQGQLTEPVFAQVGHTTYQPTHYSYTDFLSKEEFDAQVAQCDLLITHSGVGSIISGLRSRKPVIVVPRLAQFGEHVDDHQLEIAESFQQQNYVVACLDTQQLPEAIAQARSTQFGVYHSQRQQVLTTIRDFLGTL